MKRHSSTTVAEREERLVALLQSWKRAHRELQRRGDPFADMLAADIAKLAAGIDDHRLQRPRGFEAQNGAANRTERRLN